MMEFGILCSRWGLQNIFNNSTVWLRYMASNMLWFCAGLSIISYFKLRKELSPYQKIPWLVPLTAYIFFFSYAGVSDRYSVVTFPILIILGMQVFNFPSIHSFINGIKHLSYLSIPTCIVSIFILSFVIKNHAISADIWIYPLILMMILVIFVKKWIPVLQGIILFCLMLAVVPNILYYSLPFFQGQQVYALQRRFIPYEMTKAYMHCDREKNIFVSGNFYKQYGILGRNADTSRQMFALFYHCDIPLEHFYQHGSQGGRVNPMMGEDILPMEEIEESILLERDYSYMYLTGVDWQGVDQETRKILMEKYQIEKFNWITNNKIEDFRAVPIRNIKFLFFHSKKENIPS